ncbi:tryptophan 7-halogenase [Burkholderia sp. DN3021]|uniref:tryptophan 7-halogenase n=1 Tax=Burkholderia sp. DN3021 TaxID=3410137 RepID=UPI003C7DC2C4
MSHAWHFDAHLVANYLGDLAVSWGVEHIEGEVVETRLNEDGEIKSARLQSGAEITADFFVDCSGFKGLLINQALNKPFIDMSRSRLADGPFGGAKIGRPMAR